MVYGRALVDDWPPYVEAWLEYRPRGLVIMPDRPWNQGFSHPNVVRALGDPESGRNTNKEEIITRLQHAAEREDGEA